ncbi:hypothetical protein NBH00_09075 [Paraconexibacter antarcticus]|uniref:Cellulase (Glycosyl hydrolase family 5) n=1 Tax=Paraconexibacter antarcticus TaxID=2949664 RepID=A0ABY5E0I5_9ACTN|nr:hypothetical protein [Paraconexibacter antarcticus]UTI66345.1 hypothetical protein NBH00_09075 [Paraconexibacter antarcticus]
MTPSRPLRRPRALRTFLSAALLTAAAATAVPAAAPAAVNQESMLQDDNTLIFNTPQGTAKALDRLVTLGVDRVRVSVFWATVAPKSDSQTRPVFDAANPSAYPAHAWDRYDQLVRLATARGIAVNFDITSPAPLWATGDSPRADIANTFQPDPAEFEQFVRAVGNRYSGTFGAPGGSYPQPPRPALCELSSTCPPKEPQPPVLADGPVPRVSYFSIWNEPNQPGWLTPQWIVRPDGAPGYIEAAPHLYRGLVDAAWRGLQATNHGSDTFLIGETAPKGLNLQDTTRAIKPMRFIRQLYCLDDQMHPLRGAEAAMRDCPTDDAGTAAFADAHPGLFAATGYAHHPYELTAPPTRRPTDPDYVTIANLPRLTLALRDIFTIYGRANGLPLYLTEFGYNTDPPNPLGVSPGRQASYLNQAQYIASTNPSVRTLTQFLLIDDAPRPGRNGVTAGYGATFQTGLQYLSGRRKPSFAAYELALNLPVRTVARGRRVLVWGLVRPASLIGRPQLAQIQFKRRGGGFRTVKRVRTLYGRGVVQTRITLAHSGFVRLTWKDPRTRKTVRSRVVSVAVRR